MRSLFRHRRAASLAGLFAAASLTLAACGSGGTSSGDQSGGGAAQQAGGGGPTLTITTPKQGATVRSPVKLSYTTDAKIGPPSSGEDHVHVFTDGKTQDYTVVPTKTYMIKNLAPGKHTIGVTLQHADHSPVGPKAQVTVTVVGGSGGSGGASGGTGGGGGGYSY